MINDPYGMFSNQGVEMSDEDGLVKKTEQAAMSLEPEKPNWGKENHHKTNITSLIGPLRPEIHFSREH